ncbi:MAG TPA: ABC-2 transporter permease [Anaerolineae bacterium]|nr:ABC-2 transporter permease [Anaerolineae bacterium]
MSSRRVLTLAQRVMRQVLRDRRTVGLLIIGPMLVLSLGAVLFRSEPAVIPLGVVNEDQGLTVPIVGSIELGQRIVDELTAGDAFNVVFLDHHDVDARLRDGTVQGVIVFPEDFSSKFQENRQVVIDLHIEGSNPTRSMTIIARVTETSMKSLAELVGTSFAIPGSPQTSEGEAALPVVVQTTYLYAGEEFDTMDFVAPVYIAILALFFVFLLACVSFLRERSLGTMERLLATPATRIEIVLGYMLGLGLFALIQVAVILFYTVWVLEIHYLGSLGLLFLVIALLAVVGVNLGILASAFARNEFQVVQFIPLLIIPQILLGGTFWAVSEMPKYLQPFAYLMPIYYANQALRDVMLKGWGLVEIWPNMVILAGIAGVLIVAGALMMRREVA